MFQSLFTATKLQVATYLLGVALFSISFLVFLNASISFVVTDLIGQKARVGDAVGTLGFADELVVLVACPLWGLLSDKLGVRTVVVVGYAIVGLSLFVFVQAKTVYPGLLLSRLLFSIGGAATSTMVTAILPIMTLPNAAGFRGRSHVASMSSESGPSPGGYLPAPCPAQDARTSPDRSTSQIAGFVGMFTGLGALLALGAFLPLPARLQRQGYTPADAITDSYYIVGSIAFAVALSCALGLSGLAGEEDKGVVNIFRRLRYASIDGSKSQERSAPMFRLFFEALKLGFTNIDIALGYVGGFVARASSVGISLFIPLYVNAYFVSSGLCKDKPDSDPADIKQNCRDAYVVAAVLSGVSQLVALLSAPLFGYIDSRFHRFNAPLLFSAAAGVIGYVLLARLPSPEPSGERGSASVFLVMALLGISQIGAIVCSLSSLGRGIQGSEETSSSGIESHEATATQESSPLLHSDSPRLAQPPQSRNHIKGSIAGLYSLAGGVGILLLTKLGGSLFDTLSPGAPFYMLAIFNACLLVIGTACGIFRSKPMAQAVSRVD